MGPDGRAVLADVPLFERVAGYFSPRELMEPFDAGEIVGVRQVLDAPPEDLLAGVAEDVALPLVDAKPSALEIEMADANSGVLERPSEPLLTFPQGRLGTLPFLGVVEGMVDWALPIDEVVAAGPAKDSPSPQIIAPFSAKSASAIQSPAPSPKTSGAVRRAGRSRRWRRRTSEQSGPEPVEVRGDHDGGKVHQYGDPSPRRDPKPSEDQSEYQGKNRRAICPRSCTERFLHENKSLKDRAETA